MDMEKYNELVRQFACINMSEGMDCKEAYDMAYNEVKQYLQ